MHPTHYRRQKIDGLDVFYREAGAPEAPAIVLLHGFPTSSHMFRDLIPKLADRFHLIAPDYPGSGYSATPDPREFAYTFDHVADVIEQLLVAKRLGSYAIYMQDFGGPVGFRLATRQPGRVRALVVQNANAYEAGLGSVMKDVVLPPYKNRTPEAEAKLKTLLERAATESQYYAGEPDATLVSPDAIEHAQWGLDRRGNKAIQLEMLANYGSNLERYPEWQRYLREHQPPTLIAWGRNDPVFPAAGAEAYRKDLHRVDLNLLDAGHFALETHCDEIAGLIRRFM